MHAYPFITIIGPTGVGKTECSRILARLCAGDIINGDMGQLYTPLSCGTAKPDWKSAEVPHHLFDIFDQPQHCSALTYRTLLAQQIARSESCGRQPIVVGGSLFYNKALFFRPQGAATELLSTPEQGSPQELWKRLEQLDPQRAQVLHPHDGYRITRALALCTTGKQSSSYAPVYDPIRPKAKFIHCIRERAELYSIIDERVDQMLAAGWWGEVCNLTPDWKDWLRVKKIIGYDDLLREVEARRAEPSSDCIRHIKQRTRNYAKRQLTLWRSYSRELEKKMPGSTIEINLTLKPFDLYLDMLFEKLYS